VKVQLQAARRARKGIEQIRKQLLCPTPEAVSACAAPLTEAIRCMEMLQADLRQGLPVRSDLARELGPEIVQLRKELAQASALLQSAAEFHEGFGRLLRSHQEPETGYSRQGAALRQPEARRFLVHG
jgi:hypothetical protein